MKCRWCGDKGCLFCTPSKMVVVERAPVAVVKVGPVERPPAVVRELKAMEAETPGWVKTEQVTDEEVKRALAIVLELRRASTSCLQRRLRVGYTKACRLMDVMEERGMIGPPRGAEPREILV